MESVKFGPFELDPVRYELRRVGRRVRISKSLMQLLLVFVERAGELVTREEITAALWDQPESVDVRQGVNTAITRLRAVLFDDPAKPRFIETVIGKGYRFVAPVEKVVDDDPLRAEADEARGPGHAPKTFPEVLIEAGKTEEIHALESVPDALGPLLAGMSGPNRVGLYPRYAVHAVALFCLTVVSLTVGIATVRLHSKSTRASSVPHAPPGSEQQDDSTIRSVAVLPLENLSADQNLQYFSDGLTDELIARLAQSIQARVISRASSMHLRGASLSSKQIADLLGVDAFIQGSVQRSGRQLHVTAHLVDARLDRVLWSENYEVPVSASIAIVDTMARELDRYIPARAIAESHPVAASIPSPQAYDDYLRGRAQWNRRDPVSTIKAIKYFQRSVQEQPDFARAHAGLADAYFIATQNYALPAHESLKLAKGEAAEALRLDGGLAEAHASTGILSESSLEWEYAEQEYRRALALDPSYATANQWYSDLLSRLGRHEEAIEQAQKAVKADPLSPMIRTQLGVAYYYARQYDKAIDTFKATLEMDAGFVPAIARLATAYAQEGKYEAAERVLSTAPASDAKNCTLLSMYAYVEGEAGHKSKAKSLTRLLLQQGADAEDLLYAYVPEDRNTALHLMRQSLDERKSSNFNAEPAFDSLRSDPRFNHVIALLHLPAGTPTALKGLNLATP